MQGPHQTRFFAIGKTLNLKLRTNQRRFVLIT